MSKRTALPWALLIFVVMLWLLSRCGSDDKQEVQFTGPPSVTFSAGDPAEPFTEASPSVEETTPPDIDDSDFYDETDGLDDTDVPEVSPPPMLSAGDKRAKTVLGYCKKHFRSTATIRLSVMPAEGGTAYKVSISNLNKGVVGATYDGDGVALSEAPEPGNDVTWEAASNAAVQGGVYFLNNSKKPHTFGRNTYTVEAPSGGVITAVGVCAYEW